MSLLSELSGRFKKKLDENNGNVIKTFTPNTITSTINEVRNNAIKSGALKTQQANTVNSVGTTHTTDAVSSPRVVTIHESLNSNSSSNNSRPILDMSIKGGNVGQNLIDKSNFLIKQAAANRKAREMNTIKSNLSKKVEDDDGWKQYYDSEFEKAKPKGNFFETFNANLIDQGSTSRIAEQNARNKYVNKLLELAYDDDGNVKDQAIANKAKELADYNVKVSNNYGEMERAKSRKIGASYDSDYKDNPWKAAANVVRNMSVADTILGVDDTQKTDASDAGRFVLNLLPGMATAPIVGGTNIVEAVSGSGTDSTTGKERELDAVERLGRGLSGAVDAAGVFFGGSGDLLKSVGNAVFKRTASEVTKQAVKNTTKGVIKELISAMLEEGAEEGIQQVFDFFGDGGKLVTSDGEFDADSFKQLLGEVGQSAALGAIGGGIFHVGGKAIDAAAKGVKTGFNLDNKLINNANTSVNENVQYNADGDAVKVDGNGITTKLTDEELAASVNLEAEPIKINGETDTNIAQDNVNANINETQKVTTNPAVNNATNVANTVMQEVNTNNQATTQPSLNRVNALSENSVSSKAEYQRQMSDLVERAKNGDAKAEVELKKMLGMAPDEDFNASEKTDWRPETVDETIDSNAQNGVFQRYFENMQDEAQAQKLNLGEAVDALFRPKQPAYAMATTDGGYYRPETEVANRNNDANFTIRNENGKNVVQSDFPISRSLSQTEASREARNNLKNIKNKTVKMGDSDTDATFNKNNRSELARRNSSMSGNQYRAKLDLMGNADELFRIAENVKTENNRKSSAKPDVEGYLSGKSYGKDGTGKLYEMQVKSEIKKDGSVNPYSITELNEIPGRGYLKSGDQTRNAQGSLSDDIVSQNGENVNTKLAGEEYSSFARKTSENGNFSDEVRQALKEDPLTYKPTIEAEIKGDNLKIYDLRNTKKLSAEDLNLQPGDPSLDARTAGSDDIVSQNGENVNTKPTGEFDVDKYVTDQVKAQKQRAKTPLGERVSDVTAELKHHLVDDAVAYERYIKDKNERLNIREGVDRVRSSDMIAGQYMRDNGLMELGKLSTKDLNEFQQYLIAKRAIEVEAQGKNSGRNLAADRALVKAVGDKYKAQEQIVRNYTKSMLEYSVKNGLIGEGLKEKLLRENPNYVPMNRVMEGIEEHTGNMKSKQLGNLSKQTVVQKMKGSDLTVDNPVESLIVNTMRMINEGERNKTAKLIADSDVFKENRLEAGQKASRGMDTLNFMVDGEKVSYEVPKLVAQEMKNLNSVLPDYANNVLKVLGTPTKFLRAGATGNNPMFALSNVVRDQMQTLVTGSVRANLRGTPDALMATFGKGAKAEALRAELSRAGIIGNEFRQTYGYKSGDLMAELQSEAKWTKAAQEKLKHPVNAIADVIGKTEYFTRAQQYFGTNGDATAKAQAARNNTLNFSRAGSTVRVLNRIIPFLNAGVQGGRATVNAVVQRPVHTTVMLASLAGVGMAAQALGRATDSELWDRLGDEEKKQNIVIFTPDAHYDSESNRVEGVIKIPVAQMLYPIMDVVNNLKGDASDLATVAADLFTATTGLEAPDTDANTLQEAFLPMVNQLTPTAIKPVLEATMNKNTYTGKELVSDYDSNKAPEDKGAKYTSGIAREIAKITGVDAPVVDNFIQNWGGGLATDLAKAMTDNPDNAKDGGGLATIFTKGFNRRFQSGSVTSQYEIAEGLAKNYKNEVKNLEGFSDLSAKNQQKVLNAIDSDLNAIASMAAKAEQGRTEDIGDSKLSYRQSQIAENGFDATSYVKAVLDKDEVYSNGGTSAGSIKTLAGSLADYEKTTIRKNPIEISDDLIGTSRDYLDKYNSMTEKEWNKFIEGNTAESAAAEYNLAIAKYENDLANGDLTDVQKIKRQKELAKLGVSQNWTKDVRDAYSLAGNKADIQEYLNTISGEKRAEMIGMLNGLNNAMYEAEMISETTYNSRARNINNLKTSKKSSSSASKTNVSATEGNMLAKLAQTTGNSTYGYDVKTTAAPTTNRKSGISSGRSYNVNAYHATGATKATARKGK